MSESKTPMDDALAAGDGTLHGAIDHWQARAVQAETDRAELVEALRHMQWCRSCAEGSWEDCDGGRDALALLARIEAMR